MPLLCLPLPSLVDFNVTLVNPRLFQDILESFPESSPNIRTLFLLVGQSDTIFSKLISGCICRWRNLEVVVCPEIVLDVNALVHLSHLPVLTRLTSSLDVTLPSSDSLLVFANLQEFTLHARSLQPISRSLSQIRLPAITDFTVLVRQYSRQDLISFLSNVPTSNIGHTVKKLQLVQLDPSAGNIHRQEVLPLDPDDLRPCMAFENLRHVNLNIKCYVDLTDNQVLALASAWPHLEHLLINEDWGWRSQGGITPGGLVQLLRMCRSLNQVALRFDTQGYSHVPPSQAPENLGLTLSPDLSVDVVDSAIEPDSVMPLAMFFFSIATCSGPGFSLHAWNGTPMIYFQNMVEYMHRWYLVREKMNNALNPSSHSEPSDLDRAFLQALEEWPFNNFV